MKIYARKLAVILCASLCGVARSAADAPAAVEFDPRIDTWVEGEITAIDATRGTLSLNGVNLPHETMVAKFRQERAKAVQDAAPAQRAEVAEKIQASWQKRLDEAAKASPAGKTLPFNFNLAKDAVLIVNSKDSGNVNFALKGSAPATAALLVNFKEGATEKLAELKEGERIQVGFAVGKLSNEAFVIIRGAAARANEQR
jgi:hypothetical protein